MVHHIFGEDLAIWMDEMSDPVRIPLPRGRAAKTTKTV